MPLTGMPLKKNSSVSPIYGSSETPRRRHFRGLLWDSLHRHFVTPRHVTCTRGERMFHPGDAHKRPGISRT